MSDREAPAGGEKALSVPVADLFARRVVKPLHERLVLRRHLHTLCEALLRLLPPGERLEGMDVGCGSGRLARMMMARRPGLEMSGADLVVRPDAVIPVVRFDGTRLPFGDHAFDFAMVVDVLHHASDPATLLRECRRVSRGPILLKDHLCESRWDELRLRLMDWGGNRAEGIPMPYRYLSRAGWERLFKETGLRAAKTRERLGLFPPPLSLLFERGLQVLTRLEGDG